MEPACSVTPLVLLVQETLPFALLVLHQATSFGWKTIPAVQNVYLFISIRIRTMPMVESIEFAENVMKPVGIALDLVHTTAQVVQTAVCF